MDKEKQMIFFELDELKCIKKCISVYDNDRQVSMHTELLNKIKSVIEAFQHLEKICISQNV